MQALQNWDRSQFGELQFFEERKPFKLQMMYVLWIILFQTKKCSYWGKCNPNLDNCSYCEERKPYDILKNFLLLLTWYYFNLVELRNLLHTIPDVTKRLVVITTLCSQSIRSSKQLEPLWKAT